MSETTHAFLPAKKIAAACDGALRSIEQARHDIAIDLARALRRQRWSLWLKPLTRIAMRMPDYLKEIMAQHRAAEEATVIAIRDLAHAAMREDEDFTIHVAASDFALLKGHYPR